MMKKLLSALLSMMLVTVAYGQWTKPTLKTQPLTVGTEYYLYNLDAEGFLAGANDWGTRASIVTSTGHKIWLEKFEFDDVVWDGETYRIGNYVEAHGNTREYMFMDGVSNFWVDRLIDTDEVKKYGGFLFVNVGDNVYKFQPAKNNENLSYDLYGSYFIGMKPVTDDLRLYLGCPEVDDRFGDDDWYSRWVFVLPADYDTYVSETKRYNAALALGEIIETAKASGADVAEASAVYNNTNSTTDQLQNAAWNLAGKIASVEKPVDITSTTIVNPSYNKDNNDGWSGDTPGFQSYGNAERYWGNINHYQQLPELPAGVYRVQVTGFYRAGWKEQDADRYQETLELTGENPWQKGKLYVTGSVWDHQSPLPMLSSGASETAPEGSSAAVETNVGFVPDNMHTADIFVKAGQYAPTQLNVIVKTGQKMTIGLQKTETLDGDWMCWDDWRMMYLGTGDEAYQSVAKEALESGTDYEALKEAGEEFYYQHLVYEAYLTAKHNLQAATAAADVIDALEKFAPALEGMKTSADAYAKYFEAITAAFEWLDTKDSDSDEIILLSDYLGGATGEGFNGHGSSDYILENGTLSAEEIAAEMEYLNKILTDAMANSMADGDDCTELLRNPNFEQSTGWTTTSSLTYPTGGRPVLQGWNMVFDVYQELEGLQNGLYELDYNALYRPGNAGEFNAEHVEAAKAYAYINNYQSKLPGILDDLSEEPLTSGDYLYEKDLYGPNDGKDGAEGAYTYFQAGRYAGHVYGLVTDGTMKVGFLNNLRVTDGSAAWIGPVKLIFRSKNVEALREVISNTNVTVNELLSNYCGKPELDAMETAATYASECADEDLYNALIDLKEKIEAVEEGTSIYQKLAVALFNLDQAILGNTTAGADVIKKAKALYNECMDAYQTQAYSSAEAEEATANLNAMVVNILFPDGEASEENPVDYTSAIVNSNFDPDRGSKNDGTIDGWTTTAMNGYKEYTVSYNRAPFELNQKLTGLPKGKYKVTVHTYYRAGYYNEEETRVANGEETHLTTLYAQTSADRFETKVMNLYEDATDQPVDDVKCYTLSNGKYAPDGTSPTAAYFKAGYYLNELRFTVPEDGEVTIGLSKKETYANDYEVVGEWKLWYMGEEQEGLADEQDMSSLIVNNKFDPDRGDKNSQTIDGWVTSAMNGYKENTVSYNRAGIDLYQDLSGLREGTYKVTVHTYYRAGYYNEEEDRIARGEETHLTTFYAKTADETYSKPVMNLCEDATDEPVDDVKCYTLSNGKYAPDGTTPTVAYFKAGYYLNELPFYVGADGNVRIGLKKTKVLANDYEVVGEWNLYYYGSGNNVDLLTGVEEVAVRPAAMPAGIYSLSGARLNTLQRGINIVRMADGSVRKVLVK
ncbi:MAG: hypothetical protein IJ197_03325 [Bacteroidaceae bacterium]|nr:hypothetical protein [Bacteroidaceae bacterium]